MATKRKHNEVTLKAKYEELKELGKIDLTMKLAFSSTFLEVHFLLVANQSRSLSVEQTVSEFFGQPTEVITDGDGENEDKVSDEQVAHP